MVFPDQVDQLDYRDLKANKDRRVILQDLRPQLTQDQSRPDPLDILDEADQ